MRYLVASVVFILLFIVPAGSWYYLQSGLDYRKDALKELEPKGVFDVNGFDVARLKSKTTLFQLKSVQEDVLDKLHGQYSKSATYQMLTLDTPTEVLPNWKSITIEEANLISMKYDGAGFVLVDTSMMVRNTYPADMEGVRRMIEHTSIILPRVRELDVKQKKRNEGE